MLAKDVIEKVLAQAQQSASYSWEYGTVFEALLEYHDPQHTVFHSQAPIEEVPCLSLDDVEALRYIKPYIEIDKNRLIDGKGSSADPTSLAIPSLLLSKSLDDPRYHTLVTNHLTTLLTAVPRFTPNGAISHRDAYPSLWADFIYMVPPFLAYHSATTSSLNLARESVRQCELYCKLLGSESGSWKHIVNAPDMDVSDVGEIKQDDGLWSTGNAWAAAGMARVLATLRKSGLEKDMQDELESLVCMIRDIIDGAMSFDTDSSGLLRNRLDDESWFGEAAGTALFAATCFRMAVLEPMVFGARYVVWAEWKMRVVEECVDEMGIVAPVVNPTKDEQRNPLEGVSPEAQAFVVLMYCAWRD